MTRMTGRRVSLTRSHPSITMMQEAERELFARDRRCPEGWPAVVRWRGGAVACIARGARRRPRAQHLAPRATRYYELRTRNSLADSARLVLFMTA